MQPAVHCTVNKNESTKIHHNSCIKADSSTVNKNENTKIQKIHHDGCIKADNSVQSKVQVKASLVTVYSSLRMQICLFSTVRFQTFQVQVNTSMQESKDANVTFLHCAF